MHTDVKYSDLRILLSLTHDLCHTLPSGKPSVLTETL